MIHLRTIVVRLELKIHEVLAGQLTFMSRQGLTALASKLWVSVDLMKDKMRERERAQGGEEEKVSLLAKKFCQT